MSKRNIGIVGDGATDRTIFRKIAEVILESDSSDCNYVELPRHNLHDFIERYWRESSNINEYYLPSPHAKNIQNDIAHLLSYGVFSDFEQEVGIGALSDRDILLVTTDAERSLTKPEDYFQDWAFSISKILMGAIDKFYYIKAREGYPREYLPIVISIVTFPSTEIIVAAAKNIPDNQKYGKKASELKYLLYGTTDLRTLKDEEFQEKAIDFITPESINNIFKSVPESRIFIQTLSLGKCL